ncbi:MAG: CDP-diacylglycerol--serine O-phosphatidyltransferase [Cytophagales bacterium]|nr:MAG: CDP-diacylglycerol--serine O-phosphatidyltransferase [Cytophagales bacterium]
MRIIFKHLPNAITCGNLVCGCVGIIEVFNNRPIHAYWLILLAGVLDFFDGFVARLLKVQSPIGKELDSLADMVTFGALPGFIMFYLIGFDITSSVFVPNKLTYVALIIPVFSALRLAKFNIDTRQSEQFIGLPTPANAMFLGAFPLILNSKYFYSFWLSQSIIIQWALVFISVLSAFMLVAPVPLIALKFKNFQWRYNQMKYLLVGFSLFLILFYQLFALPIIIILYIALSIIDNIFKISRP